MWILGWQGVGLRVSETCGFLRDFEGVHGNQGSGLGGGGGGGGGGVRALALRPRDAKLPLPPPPPLNPKP